MRVRWKAFSSKMMIATLILVGASACTKRVEQRGVEINSDQVSMLEPGIHTKTHVLDLLGSPSSQTVFGDETWLYIHERREAVAFMAPELVDRRILVIRFDQNGVISEVGNLDEQQAQNIEPVDRATPTAGNRLTVMEQFLSNLGRFNKKK